MLSASATSVKLVGLKFLTLDLDGLSVAADGGTDAQVPGRVVDFTKGNLDGLNDNQLSITTGPSTPPVPSAPDVWGAIGFTSDGSYATAWKVAAKAEAEADVAKRCARMGRGACEVVSFPGELCVALANYRGGGYRAADAAQDISWTWRVRTRRRAA